MGSLTRIGIVGTGFIAKGLALALENQPSLVISKVLTRRDPRVCSNFPLRDVLTNSLNELVDHADLIIECSGDVLHGTDVVDVALAAGLPVVTMNAELHVTTGSYFVGKGILTEAEGDQPGCLAALHYEAVQMGFTPLVYGNIKGFLNNAPTLEQMRLSSRKHGISLQQVTAFTDGTKVQIEQALVANGLGAGIAVPGLLGLTTDSITDAANVLADGAKALEIPISDYVLAPKLPAGVFIVAEHDERQRKYLRYLKMGEGPYYVLLRNHHLCHLEIIKTVRMVGNGDGILLNNTEEPTISVAAVAKKPLTPGDTIDRGIGSFKVRGSAVRISQSRGHVPIGLLAHAKVTRRVEPGQTIRFDAVDIPGSLALQAWLAIEQRVLQKATVTVS